MVIDTNAQLKGYRLGSSVRVEQIQEKENKKRRFADLYINIKNNIKNYGPNLKEGQGRGQIYTKQFA